MSDFDLYIRPENLKVLAIISLLLTFNSCSDKFLPFLHADKINLYHLQKAEKIEGTKLLQRAIDYANANGVKEIMIPRNYTVACENIYLYGNVSLVGEDTTSVILINKDLNNYDGKQAWISLGIQAKGIPYNKGWSGTISKLKFKAGKNSIFNRAIWIFHSKAGKITNCVFDFRLMQQGRSLGTAIESGNNVNWNPRYNIRDKIVIENNRVYASQYNGYGGGEGIGLTGATNSRISNNYISGVADDVLASHGCKNLIIDNNTCLSTAGRIYISNSQNIFVKKNFSKRVPTKNGNFLLSSFLVCELESSIPGSPQCENIEITDNVFYAMENSKIAYWLRLRGIQKCLVKNNILENQSLYGEENNIVIEPQIKANWLGKIDSPDYKTEISKPRNYYIIGNKMIGKYPEGEIKENAIRKIYTIGPIEVRNNKIGSLRSVNKKVYKTRNNRFTNEEKG